MLVVYCFYKSFYFFIFIFICEANIKSIGMDKILCYVVIKIYFLILVEFVKRCKLFFIKESNITQQ